jgi:hypothetical protein
MMKKRLQHHVWQHYLKAWTVDGQIYCLQGGRIFPTGTPVVAVERDFYKLHHLQPNDIGMIKILAIAHPAAKKAHENFIALLTAPMRFVEQNREHLRNVAKIDELLDIYMTNTLEDYHAGIEASFIPLLDKMKNGDITFSEDDGNYTTFLHFICAQYMRTRGIKVRAIENVEQNNRYDLSRIWNILSYLLSVNIGASLFVERARRKLVLIKNNTEAAFITGDQPVINLQGGGPKPPEMLTLYYPISPRLAIVLSEVDEEPTVTTESLTPAHVSDLNAKMLEACHSQVFGQSKESLLSSRDRAPKRGHQ